MELSNNTSFQKESYPRLFFRFLRFGSLAWGGPIAQIAMIRQDLVEKERWISPEKFNRILALYQALPGPEAHEICVYFGMLARGRLGGILAGLGFMLPGFVLMFALSWFYAAHGIGSPLFSALLYGTQAAVSALIIHAIHRIGQHAITDYWLFGIAICAAVAQFLGGHFIFILVFTGAACVFLKRRSYLLTGLLITLFITGLLFIPQNLFDLGIDAKDTYTREGSGEPSLLNLLISGFRSGLLTFGGAYTVIPFLQHDAVVTGGWITNNQFLDGIALSSILPAPLIIFATFVGYIGGGALGAVALTAGIFAPAFSSALIGHKYLEKIVENQSLHTFNDGVTAGVVGLISATTLDILKIAISDIYTIGILMFSLLVLYRWKAKITVVFVVLGAGIAGILLKI